MVTDTQVMGRPPVKPHTEGVLIDPDLLEIQIRRILVKKEVLLCTVPQWALHLDLAMVLLGCKIPQSVGRMERVFTSKTAPGIHSISPFSYFSPYFTITGFQSCYSVSGIHWCNHGVG